MVVEKDVQKRILKALWESGGTANTYEITEATGLKVASVHGGTRLLISRALIRKHPVTMKKIGGYGKAIFSIREGNPLITAKIKKLISEIE